ncbi:MAG: efflux RND transporter permease subunit [Candidatus Pacebacteria bacterium]|nr:efflux RND transporter permease subunit [Candidatus Paceibacterota bacterium]
MNSSFTDIFIRRPVLAIVVSALILVVGIRALMGLPIRQYPKLTEATITINTIYPGANAQLIQGFVTTPIEQAVGSVEGIAYMTSTSTQGSSSVAVRLRFDANPDRVITDIMSKVNQTKYLLPREAFDPVIVKGTGQSFALMYLGFASQVQSSAVINDYLVRVVTPILSTVPGIGEINILGGPQLAMRLWLDPKRMAARGVSALEIQQAILANNYQAAPGQAKSSFTVSNVIADTGMKSIEQFRNLIIKSNGATIIRMSDIGDVDIGPDSVNSTIWLNGVNALFVSVNASPAGNPLTVAAAVNKLLPEIQKSLPAGMTARMAFDATIFIKSSIEEVQKTLLEAVLVVVVVIFLFLGSFRSVLIPVVTIPLSLVGAAVLMSFLGFSINLITLLAFVLAIGLVVDDAIVVVENVYRHMEEGLSPLDASLLGAREIVGPVIAMTITLAAVYAPIGLVGGVTGALFTEFAFTLAGAVLISGIVALTLSPMMCAKLLTVESTQTKFALRVERVLGKWASWYRIRLERMLTYRPAVLVFALAVLLSVPFFYSKAPKELAPQEDQGVLFMFIKGPQYANLDYMTVYLGQVDKALATIPEVHTRFAAAGLGGVNSGFGGAVLQPWGERDRTVKELQPVLTAALAKVDGLMAFIFPPPALPGSAGGPPAQMVIRGPGSYREIYDYMDQIKAIARKSGKFIFADSDLTFENPTVRIKVDEVRANSLGITMQQIGATLAIMVGGNYVNRFDFGGQAYKVIPQVARQDRLSAASLGQYYVPAIGGKMVPLSTVVSMTTTVEPGSLARFNQLNSATFNAVPRPFVTMADAVEAMRSAATAVLPPGYSYEFMSDARQYVEEGNRLLTTFAFALVIIFLVLAAQFESLRDPLVILVSVPMSVAGAMLPLFLGVTTINIYTQIGLVTLIGLISKHGILMVSFAKDLQIEHGWDRHRAIVEAAEIRLRPILMTTGAMVVGLLPLLLAVGAGAASRFSIGLVIVVGMLIGTLFTLFVLPAVFTVLGTDHAAVKARRDARG